MDEGGGLTPEAVKERRKATDLALRAIKHTTRAVGRYIAAERHLWLILTEIRVKEKVFLLDAPISQTGLFGEVVSSMVEKFRSNKSQSAAHRQFMPRTTRDHSNTPSSSLSRECSLPRKETASRSIIAVSHCALAPSRATTRTVSELNVWVFRTRARGCLQHLKMHILQKHPSQNPTLGSWFSCFCVAQW